MRREALYLRDIVEAADAIAAFLTGVQRERFLEDDLVRSAVLHKLTVIGEAATRLPVEFRERHQQVPWRSIIGFRNIAVHAYFSVDWAIVWETAGSHVPELRRHVAQVIEHEYPELRIAE